MSLRLGQPTQSILNKFKLIVKLKNLKTDRNIFKKDENQVNSIQIKSNGQKSNQGEMDNLSKKENYFDYKYSSKGRKDSRGVPIIKGKKTHKISYADNLYGTNLAIMINVESYKLYNCIETDSTNDENSMTKKRNGISCKCTIL